MDIWGKNLNLTASAGFSALTRQAMGQGLGDPYTNRALFVVCTTEAEALARKKRVRLPGDTCEKPLSRYAGEAKARPAIALTWCGTAHGTGCVSRHGRAAG